MNQRIWAPVDVSRLLDYIKADKKVSDIARLLKRSDSSVQAKLKDIAVDLYFNKNMAYELVQEITGIAKEDLLVRRTGVAKEPISIPEIPRYTIRLSTENPFSIESISSLLLSTIEQCLTSSQQLQQ